jgi:hypothetical protein
VDSLAFAVAQWTLTTLYLGVLALLVLFGLHRWHLLLLARGHDSTPHPAAAGLRQPEVTVQLPIYNEPAVAGRLLRAVARLDYPRHLLEIQVLDDSTDGTSRHLERQVRRYAALGYRITHLRRRHRDGFKAGALRDGLACSRGELVAIFDADFIPSPDFITRSLPAFADPRVGMVQARWGHLNRKRSILTRVQAALLDGHFLVEHLARQRAGCFFNFNGTAGIWRKACIEDAGGWQADTLTEDLDLSYRAQLAGWRFIFLPDLVAPAELPAGTQAWKTQQHRWAKGSIETARKLLPQIWRSPLPRPVRLAALFHLGGNGAYLLLFLLCLLIWPAHSLRPQGLTGLMAVLDLAVLGTATASVLCFYYQAQRRAGVGRASSLLCLPPLLGLGAALALNNTLAVLEALAGRRSDFLRTPKDGLRDKRVAPRRQGPASLPIPETLMALYLIATLVATLRQGAWTWVPFTALFFWGYAYLAVAALRQGRLPLRSA